MRRTCPARIIYATPGKSEAATGLAPVEGQLEQRQPANLRIVEREHERTFTAPVRSGGPSRSRRGRASLDAKGGWVKRKGNRQEAKVVDRKRPSPISVAASLRSSANLMIKPRRAEKRAFPSPETSRALSGGLQATEPCRGSIRCRSPSPSRQILCPSPRARRALEAALCRCARTGTRPRGAAALGHIRGLHARCRASDAAAFSDSDAGGRGKPAAARADREYRAHHGVALPGHLHPGRGLLPPGRDPVSRLPAGAHHRGSPAVSR